LQNKGLRYNVILHPVHFYLIDPFKKYTPAYFDIFFTNQVLAVSQKQYPVPGDPVTAIPKTTKYGESFQAKKRNVNAKASNGNTLINEKITVGLSMISS
jgi:hypothetical protein